MRPCLPLAPTLLLGLACFLPTDPAERLDLTISLSTAQVHADSGVVIRLAATNRHWQTIQFRTSEGCELGYEVFAPGGVDVRERYALGCVLRERTVTLAPGESLEREFHLYPWPGLGGTSGVTRWPAGRYRIVGYLVGEHGKVKETAPVTFDLVCRDPAWTDC